MNIQILLFLFLAFSWIPSSYAKANPKNTQPKFHSLGEAIEAIAQNDKSHVNKPLKSMQVKSYLLGNLSIVDNVLRSKKFQKYPLWSGLITLVSDEEPSEAVSNNIQEIKMNTDLHVLQKLKKRMQEIELRCSVLIPNDQKLTKLNKTIIGSRKTNIRGVSQEKIDFSKQPYLITINRTKTEKDSAHPETDDIYSSFILGSKWKENSSIYQLNSFYLFLAKLSERVDAFEYGEPVVSFKEYELSSKVIFFSIVEYLMSPSSGCNWQGSVIDRDKCINSLKNIDTKILFNKLQKNFQVGGSSMVNRNVSQADSQLLAKLANNKISDFFGKDISSKVAFKQYKVKKNSYSIKPIFVY